MSHDSLEPPSRGPSQKEGSLVRRPTGLGTVSAAVLAVLTDSGEEMQAKAIHEEVERLLGGPVSRFSVSDYLLTRARSQNPPLERTRHGHYRIAPVPPSEPLELC